MAEDADDKDRRIRTAFNSLFHAARIAAMSYLATENARWGGIKRRLLQLYRAEFEEFINTLHIDYFYNGYLFRFLKLSIAHNSENYL